VNVMIRFIRWSWSVIFLLLLTRAAQAEPVQKGTITAVENKVALGELKQGATREKPAAVSDVVTDKNFVRTQLESRTEMTFDDGSLVRVGQNTIFSFNEDARILSLKRGSALFYLSRGQAELKTPTLTAAITGTVAVGYSVLDSSGHPTSEGVGNVEGSVTVNGVEVPPGLMYRCDSIGGEKTFALVPFEDNGRLYTFGSKKFKIERAAAMPDVRELTHKWDHYQIGVVDRPDRLRVKEKPTSSPTPAPTPPPRPKPTPTPSPSPGGG
jgi:hypothetical protein